MLNRLIRVLLVLSLATGTFSANNAVIADTSVNGTINVDLSNDRGTYVRMEEYGNFTGRGQDQNGAIRTTDLKFMQYNGMNGKMMRMWVNLMDDFTYYDADGNITTDGSKVAVAAFASGRSLQTHFNEMSPFVKDFLVCIQHPNMIPTDTWNANGLKNRYAAAITKLVQAYPQSRYFEVVNEPDLNSGSFYSTVDQYYDVYYKAHYEGIKIANDRLGFSGTSKELKLGGPVTAMFMPTSNNSEGKSQKYYIRDFIRRYKDDTSANKRLDFISYHEYGGSYKGDPAFFGTEQGLIQDWLSENWNGKTLDKNMPIFVSETGIFAGDQTSNLDFSSDLFVVAAGVASMNYHYVYGGYNKPQQLFPFMWVPRHTQNDNWRKNMLVTDRLNNQNGAILYKFTPLGNMFKMLGMLRENRVGTSVSPDRTGSAGDGKSLGLYAFGTKDDKSVAVMMWNYQYDNRSNLASPFNDGNITYNVTANINRLDSIPAFSGKDILVKLYRIDAFGSSYAHSNGSKIPGAVTEASNGSITIDRNLLNLDGANLVPYEEYITTPVNNTVTVNYTFDRNKFRFVELVPVPRQNTIKAENLISADVRDGTGRPILSWEKNAVAEELSGQEWIVTPNANNSILNNMFDGDINTRWGAANGNFPYRVTLDLAHPYALSDIGIYWYEGESGINQRIYRYILETSEDGQNYTMVHDGSKNTNMARTRDSADVTAQYVRVTILGASDNGYASIREIKVNGIKPDYTVFEPEFLRDGQKIIQFQGQGFSAMARLENTRIQALDAMLILALYDDKGRLLDLMSTGKTLPKGTSSYLEVKMDVLPEGVSYAKAFLWNDVEKLIPLTGYKKVFEKEPE